MLLPAAALAIKAWNHLHNGHGAIDWAGLPIVAELLGIEELELTLNLMLVIKSHDPKNADEPEPEKAET